MNVLYIDAVGPFGGASRSLYEHVLGCKKKGIRPLFLVTKGTSVNWYSRLSDDVVISNGLPRFDNTKQTYYRGLRWVLVFREVLKIPSMLFAIGVAFKRFYGRVDIIHCNEITDLPAAIIVKVLIRSPLVCHVRSIQAASLTPRRSRLLRWIVSVACDHIIYIDENVLSSFPVKIPATVIHNSSRARLTIENVHLKWSQAAGSHDLNVVFFGNLQGAKGLGDLLDAFSILGERGESGVKLYIFGANTYKRLRITHWILKAVGFSTDITFDINQIIKSRRLSGTVFYKGYEDEPDKVFMNAHVLAFVSHYDAPGRPIFEAGFFGVPSIASISDARPDTFIPGVTGTHIPHGRPDLIADELQRLNAHRDSLAEMGFKAFALASASHDLENGCLTLHALYRKLAQTPA